MALSTSTITDNLSLCGWLAAVFTKGTLTVEDSIIWGNLGSFYGRSASPAGAIRAQYGGTATVTYSDIEFGWAGPGLNNINLDPLFNDSTGGDYTLQSESPCIDKGDSAAAPTGLDLNGNPRFLDGHLDGVMRVDMGAHEF